MSMNRLFSLALKKSEITEQTFEPDKNVHFRRKFQTALRGFCIYITHSKLRVIV